MRRVGGRRVRLLGRKGIGRGFLLFQDRQVTYAEIGHVELVYLQPAEVHLFHKQVADYHAADHEKTDGDAAGSKCGQCGNGGCAGASGFNDSSSWPRPTEPIRVFHGGVQDMPVTRRCRSEAPELPNSCNSRLRLHTGLPCYRSKSYVGQA
jgi:hypothetical protein